MLSVGGSAQALPADGREVLHRRDVRPDRRATSIPGASTNAYAKSAQIGGARDRLATRVDGPRPARGRHVGRDHREGQRPRRACSQRGRPVGSRSGAHGGAGAADARHGAPVHHLRGHSGSRRSRKRRCCTSSISRARSTCARSAAACCSAPMSGRRAMVREGDAVGFRPRTPAARPR